MSVSALQRDVKSEPLRCMLCGGTRFASHFPGLPEGRVEARPAPYRITHSERRLLGHIVRCRECGLVLLPTSSIVDVPYADAEDPYYAEHADDRIHNAHRLLDLLSGRGRLLEVGCACGFLLVAARERGFEVEGVEMSAWASEYARREFGLAVRTGCLERQNLPEQSYDVVVLADVIEHLTDPRSALRAIHRVLRPGGELLLLTPDIGSAIARMAGPRWWALLDDHYFYYSRETLRRLLESEGFRVDTFRALGRVFPLSHWVFKLSQYSAGLHRAVAAVLRALRLERLRITVNFGDQVACVARKI